MTSPGLPSREDFLANNLRIIGACGICLEPFNANHAPVAFSGREDCRHVFGNHCLQQWLLSTTENANKCPTCRHTLFRQGAIDHDQGQLHTEEVYDESEEEYGNDAAVSRGHVRDDWLFDEPYYDERDHSASWGLPDSSWTYPTRSRTAVAQDDAGNVETHAEVYSEWTDDEPSLEEQEDDDSDWPARLRDITNPVMAYDFTVCLAYSLKRGVWLSDTQLLQGFEDTCHDFDMRSDLNLVGRQRSNMVRLLQDLVRDDVPESPASSRLQGSLVSRLGALVGWQLEYDDTSE